MDTVLFKKLDPRAQLPKFMTPQSAGMDLYTVLDEELIINPKEVHMIPTGLSLEMPPTMKAQILPRSGLSIKYPNYLVNSPGLVDADYRGQIHILFVNNTDKTISIQNKMRLAQIVFSTVERPEIKEVDKLSNTERGAGGYGHTGL